MPDLRGSMSASGSKAAVVRYATDASISGALEVRSADRAFPFLADDPPFHLDFAGLAPVLVDRRQVLDRQRLLRIAEYDLRLAQLDWNSRKRLYIRSHEYICGVTCGARTRPDPN